jgi:hypothetical protein
LASLVAADAFAGELTRGSFGTIPASEETTNTQRFEADSLADEPVSGEPVSGADSLLTGKITGNFTKIGPFGETSPARTQQNQLVAGQFPTK